jgi:hypothetical protein
MAVQNGVAAIFGGRIAAQQLRLNAGHLHDARSSAAGAENLILPNAAASTGR